MAAPDAHPADTAAPSTVDDWLDAARRRGLDRLDARRLVGHALGRSDAWLIAHGDAPMPASAAAWLADAVARRADAVPIAYLVGRRDFHGLALQVDARVLDPRPDTETLVDWALDRLGSPADGAGATVLDLGTGSGAVALAIAQARPEARVWALDASADALAVAQANARSLGLGVSMLQGDWWDDWRPQPGCATAPASFDLVVSNPPYVAAGDPHLAALRHEPMAALVSGADGLDAIRRIVAGAAAHLAPGGALLLEHGHDQARAVETLLVAAGGDLLPGRDDLAGHRRCSGACWTPSRRP